jgi:hypothetical protein
MVWLDATEARVQGTDAWRILAAAWLIAVGLACLWLI